MRIRTQLLVAVGAAALAGLLVFVALVKVTRDNAALWQQQADAQEVARDLANLLALTNEFSAYGGERAAAQWQLRHAQLRATLDGARARDAQPQSALPELQRTLDNLPPLFNKLVEVSDEPPSPLRTRRQELLVERLLSETQELVEARHRWVLALTERHAREQNLHNVMVLGAPVLLLVLVGALAAMVARRVLWPLTRLQAATDALRRGDLATRVALDGSDELADMGRAFDAMALSLQQQAVAVQSAQRLLEVEVERRGESERMLRAVFDALPVQVFRADTELRYRFVNAEWTRATGCSAESSLGRTVREVRGEARWAALAPYLLRALDGEVLTFEWRPDGEQGARVYQTTFVPDRDEQGRLLGVYCAAADVTELKRTERRLQESERRLRAVADNLPAQIAHLDADERYLFCNAAVGQVLGVAPEQLHGRALREVRGEAFYRGIEASVRRVLAGETVEFEVGSLRAGALRTYQAVFIPDVDDAGAVRGFYSMSFDITDRKRVETELAASEQRVRNLLEQAPDAFVAVDAAGRVTEWNRQAEATFGWSRDEALGQDLAALLIPQRMRDAHHAGMARFAATGEGTVLNRRVELPAVHRDGREIPVELSIAAMHDADGHTATAFLHDISERKAAEARLRASEAQLRTVMEASPLGVFVADPAGKCRYVNDAWQRMAGLTSEQALGDGWQRVLHPDDLPRTLAYWRGETPGVEGVQEVRWQRADGELRWVRRHLAELRDGDELLGRVGIAEDITERRRLDESLRESQQRLQLVMDNVPALISYIDDERRYRLVNRTYVDWHGAAEPDILGRRLDDFYTPEQRDRWLPFVQRALAGEPVEYDLDVERHGRDRSLHVSYIPQRDAAGAVQGLYMLGFDVTELRHTERALRSKSDELARSNQELEQFAYVASHDLQEPLRMVTSYAKLLERRHGAKFEGEAREFLDFMTDGARRAQALIGDLLQLARVNSQAKPLEPVALAEVLAETAQSLRVALDESGARLTHDDALPRLCADRRQLGQLLQNLIGNALKFRGTRAPHVHVAALREPADGRWRIEVRDNGIGIEPQFHERIFVLFQRLHLRGEYAGTGIGLAICKKVVERHGGRIGVDSVPGEGSTFWFTLADAS